MATAQTLRIRRTDKQTSTLLLHVKPKGQGNIRNLKLVALDRDQRDLYHGNVKDANLKSFQTSSYSGDLTEWKKIVSFALLHEKPEGPLPDFLQGLEIVATVDDKTATLTIRKNISGITQKLGTIELQQDNEREEVDVVEWVDTAAATVDDLRHQLDGLQSSMLNHQDQVARLNEQMDDLVKSKKAFEDDLLGKFAALLNSKKAKIRDQQRLLSDAGIDVSNARSMHAGRGDDSRKGKRKATATHDAHTRNHDLLQADEADETDNERERVTPDPSDDETEEEGDVQDTTMSDLPADSTSNARGGGKGIHVDDVSTLPRRDLPFARKSDNVGRKDPDEDDTEDDEDEDDEL